MLYRGSGRRLGRVRGKRDGRSSIRRSVRSGSNGKVLESAAQKELDSFHQRHLTLQVGAQRFAGQGQEPETGQRKLRRTVCGRDGRRKSRKEEGELGDVLARLLTQEEEIIKGTGIAIGGKYWTSGRTAMNSAMLVTGWEGDVKAWCMVLRAEPDKKQVQAAKKRRKAATSGSSWSCSMWWKRIATSRLLRCTVRVEDGVSSPEKMGSGNCLRKEAVSNTTWRGSEDAIRGMMTGITATSVTADKRRVQHG